MAISKITTSGVAADTLTATDIADDAIGTAELANDVVVSTSGNITTTGKLSTPSIVQTDAQNLTGTYSTQELIMGKTFTLTGDLTVNTNLVLVNMNGSDDDVTIQDDGTATTITGTGTLEGGEMLATNNDLTGMSGVLGSAVTGSPAITGLGTVTSGTLGSGVTFPKGHIVNSAGTNYTTAALVSCYNFWSDTGLATTLTSATTGNDVYIHVSLSAGTMDTNQNTVHFRLIRNNLDVLAGVGASGGRENAIVGGYTIPTNGNRMFNVAFVYKDTLGSSGDFQYKVQTFTNGDYTVTINRSGIDQAGNYGIRGVSTMLLNEIQQ